MRELAHLEVNENTIDALVNDCWAAVKNKIESGQYLSSEKTLCFLFAMELVLRVGNLLKIDFENQCYENLEGKSKYLDLMFYTVNLYLNLNHHLHRKVSHQNSCKYLVIE
jgi:hypothetical protein